jgi:kynurenine 3-monooxygenase
LENCTGYDNLELIFDAKCTDADIRNANATFEIKGEGDKTFSADMMIGTDGAFSSIRMAMQTGGVPRFNFSQNYLEHGYKEIEMPARSGGAHKIENNALHIWPRHGYMMIALPNLDGSFTCTLFMPYAGENGFDNLDTREKVEKFAKENFADAYNLIPDFTDQYFENPTGPLATMRCSPWNYEGKTVILGDAAHAIVPFYGQGMNASFEDVYYFDKIMQNHNGDTEKAFPEFSENRKPDADAIAELALQNYIEMRSSTADPLFQAKRELEVELERDYENYSSKYNLVTFREDVGYATALKMGKMQDEFLLDLLRRSGGSADGLPREKVIEAIDQIWQKYL